METEIPIPVPIATYTARQAGHFGNTASTTPGAIVPAMLGYAARSRKRLRSINVHVAARPLPVIGRAVLIVMPHPIAHVGALATALRRQVEIVISAE